MSTFAGFFKKNLLIWPLFVVLGMCLFLGDGKQTMVDVVGTGFVLTLFVICCFFLPKQREVPPISAASWIVLLGYFFVRTLFSDETGYSIFIMLRYADAALLYTLFYSYSTDRSIKTFIQSLLVFCVFALVCSVVVVSMPTYFISLPLMNLLAATYGHNHVVDVLLVGYSIALVLWTKTKKKKYIQLTLLFVAGTIYSFARAALLFEAVFAISIVVFTLFQKKKTGRTLVILSAVIMAAATIAISVPYQQIKNKISFLPQYSKQNNFVSPRSELVKQSFLSIREHPLFGTGPGTFYLASKQYQSGPNKYSWFVHNYVLETVAETGIVGFVLVCFVFAAALYPLLIKRNFPITLIGAGAIFLYGLLDYSMNYLVVWILFWALLGMGCGSASQTNNATIKKTPLIIWLVVGLLVLGHTVLLSAFLFDRSPTKILFAQKVIQEIKTNNSNSKSVTAFHRRNPEVLNALGESYKKTDKPKHDYYSRQALLLDPKNLNYYSNYFSKNTTPQTCASFIDELGLLSKNYVQNIDPILVEAYSLQKELTYCKQLPIINEHVTDEHSVPQLVAASSYVYGLNFLEKYPNKTKELWEFSQRTDPHLSWYSVELASLESAVFKTTENIEKIFIECKQNIDAKTYCEKIEKENPKVLNIQPGSFAKAIEDKYFSGR